MFLSEIPLFELLLFGITCFFKNTVKDYFSTHFSETSNTFNFSLLYSSRRMVFQMQSSKNNVFPHFSLSCTKFTEWSMDMNGVIIVNSTMQKNIYIIINIENIKLICWMCSKSTIKTQDWWCQLMLIGFFIVNLEQIQRSIRYINLVFLFVTLNSCLRTDWSCCPFCEFHTTRPYTCDKMFNVISMCFWASDMPSFCSKSVSFDRIWLL